MRRRNISLAAALSRQSVAWETRGRARRACGDCAGRTAKAFCGKESFGHSFMSSLSGRRILLVIGGGIAAY
jgi:hypothetical protein